MYVGEKEKKTATNSQHHSVNGPEMKFCRESLARILGNGFFCAAHPTFALNMGLHQVRHVHGPAV